MLIVGGGDRDAFQRSRPAFSTFVDCIHHLGGGARQVGNMVNNLILWACISANYEGFKIGERPMPWAEKDMMMVLAEADAARISPAFCCVIKEVINCIKVERGEA